MFDYGLIDDHWAIEYSIVFDWQVFFMSSILFDRRTQVNQIIGVWLSLITERSILDIIRHPGS